ncbi:hypothetical protein [Hymenobacter fodinae]|uniref:Uncharacterized protein n=1 Tax=Hymenobacter fodinae TaxID=2510796 RepID=A0A4Z0PAR7_9BACT|nr:hypothetical protein [Hymenobacter fodinae]TGE09358.1 hypothetical protein EU556_00560 [Hymenobacter fodinae]
MPYKSNNTNQQSKENHGSPTQSEKPKGTGDLPVSNLDEQTEDRLAQEALDAGVRHPNRNLEKPDLDKPAYS